MSKQLDEINAALHSYRVLLSADIKHSQERWRKAAELLALSFEIEKLAQQLDEGFKQLDDIKIPGRYSDKQAITDLISLVESQPKGSVIHSATQLPIEQTPSFLIAKKWLSQRVGANSPGNHITVGQQKLQQAYNLVNEVSQACDKDLSLSIAGCEALRDLSKFQKLLSESQPYISANDLEQSSRASSPASETLDHQYSAPLQQKGASCND